MVMLIPSQKTPQWLTPEDDADQIANEAPAT